jgi:hypothetical protein
MSQFDDPRLDEVKRTLHRIQGIGADPPSKTGALPRSPQRPGSLSAALSTARAEYEDPMPRSSQPQFAVDRAVQAVAGQSIRVWHKLGVVLAVSAVGALAGVLTVFLALPNFSRPVANQGPSERPPGVVMALRPEFPGPALAALAHEDRNEATYTSLASAPRLVAPAEWTAPASVATNLPLSVEPPEEAARHHVLVSGLEASAFVVKGTEIIAGTWIVPANELANAKVVRSASAPARASVILELRTDAGAVVSRVQIILWAPSRATGLAVAPAN